MLLRHILLQSLLLDLPTGVLGLVARQLDGRSLKAESDIAKLRLVCRAARAAVAGGLLAMRMSSASCHLTALSSISCHNFCCSSAATTTAATVMAPSSAAPTMLPSGPVSAMSCCSAHANSPAPQFCMFTVRRRRCHGSGGGYPRKP